ncbi:hypothetical protein [Streptomyces sp. NPDC051563]|uniref:hypothetical protein n=1 Tax=Streptomyces sp. NPDC051563 TaxID=3365659 RepID=UPI0037AD3FB8
MIDQIEARVNLLRMTAPNKLTAADVDLDAAPVVLSAAGGAVADGVLGYALLIAEKSVEQVPVLCTSGSARRTTITKSLVSVPAPER